MGLRHFLRDIRYSGWKSGKVIVPNNVGSITGDLLSADDFQVDAETDYWGLRFKLDGRLLILLGAIDEDEEREGAFYCVLEDDSLKPGFSVRVKKHALCCPTHEYHQDGESVA